MVLIDVPFRRFLAFHFNFTFQALENILEVEHYHYSATFQAKKSNLEKLLCNFSRKVYQEYLKGRNFRGKIISRILAKFAKINSFFDPEKCRFAKINSREIFQELMKCKNWSFCRLFSHLFTLKTLNFYCNCSQNHKLRLWKNITNGKR